MEDRLDAVSVVADERGRVGAFVVPAPAGTNSGRGHSERCAEARAHDPCRRPRAVLEARRAVRRADRAMCVTHPWRRSGQSYTVVLPPPIATKTSTWQRAWLAAAMHTSTEGGCGRRHLAGGALHTCMTCRGPHARCRRLSHVQTVRALDAVLQQVGSEVRRYFVHVDVRPLPRGRERRVLCCRHVPEGRPQPRPLQHFVTCPSSSANGWRSSSGGGVGGVHQPTPHTSYRYMASAAIATAAAAAVAAATAPVRGLQKAAAASELAVEALHVAYLTTWVRIHVPGLLAGASTADRRGRQHP